MGRKHRRNRGDALPNHSWQGIPPRRVPLASLISDLGRREQARVASLVTSSAAAEALRELNPKQRDALRAELSESDRPGSSHCSIRMTRRDGNHVAVPCVEGTAHQKRWIVSLLAVLAILGPGLIEANAGNGAGGVLTYASAGLQFGYRTLFLMLLITVAHVVVQEMCSRLGVFTGEGFGGLIREQFSARSTYGAMTLLLIANAGLTVSDFAGVGAEMEIFGVSKYVSVPIVAVAVCTGVERSHHADVVDLHIDPGEPKAGTRVCRERADLQGCCNAVRRRRRRRGHVPHRARSDGGWLVTARRPLRPVVGRDYGDPVSGRAAPDFSSPSTRPVPSCSVAFQTSTTTT